MFGYACDETDDSCRCRSGWPTAWPSASPRSARPGTVPYLRPDGKTQVTFDYEDGKPVRLRTVLISTQHNDGIDRDDRHQARPDRARHPPVAPGRVRRRRLRGLRQPDRPLRASAAPHGDAGLTGRKIIVDTYGGMARHGGGAFSGKDPSKVDRSAAYAARWVAKNVVAAGAADRAARSRSPTPSAWPTRCRSWSRPSAPPRSTRTKIVRGRPRGLRPPPRAPSSATSTCVARSTGRPPPTATSAAPTTTSPGSTPTGRQRVDDARSRPLGAP